MSQELAEALPAAVASGRCPLPAGAALATPCTVLTTAGAAASAQLAALPLPPRRAVKHLCGGVAAAAAAAAAVDAVAAGHEREGDAAGAQPAVCVLHLGVHSGATCFHLERCAWNEATFRCADEAGWQPRGEPVLADEAPGRCRSTSLPVDALVAELCAGGHACQASDDPGRCVPLLAVLPQPTSADSCAPRPQVRLQLRILPLAGAR